LWRGNTYFSACSARTARVVYVWYPHPLISLDVSRTGVMI
jgi:hypothetical protein